MTTSTMRGFRCWSAESISETVFSDIGALASDADAVFLAAHTPVQLDHVKGPEVSANESGEQQVLRALLSRLGDQERNTLVAVTGGSGSGKSHVVRWVHAHLSADDPRYTILYVPRAVQTIRDLLRRIIQGLPGVDGAELLERVDRAVTGKSPAELQDLVIAQMRHALNWTLEDAVPHDDESEDEAVKREERNFLLGERDAENRRRDGLADLLELPAVNRTLGRADGALRQLVTSYFTETSRRDANDAIFSRDDLPLRERGVNASLAGRPELRELWQIIARNPEDAIALLEEALRAALPETLGLRSSGAETLDTLFRESRKALRHQGRELMLVFEDLAQFGLVDGELYDQFVTPPGDELAPLRVIFAVTDGAFDRMEQTVRTRVEHRFNVGGSALSNPSQFVGRYLNLVRTGRAETQERWRSVGQTDARSGWMSNACDTRESGLPCRFRDECHAAFGSVDIPELGSVGLYPYNDSALRRGIQGIDRSGDSPTPREVLDHCVTTNLIEADANLGRGEYPHARTKDRFDFFARMPKDAVLAENPSSDPERTYRAVVIWGDEEPLPVGIITAFGLDVLHSADVTPVVAPKVREEAPAQPTPTPTRASPLLPLFQWQNGDDLPEDEVNFYRRTLLDLTRSRLGLDQYLVHVYDGSGKELLDRIFNQTSFSLEGARGRRAGESSVRFDLSRTTEDLQILVAARWFRDHGHFFPARGEWEWPRPYDPARLMVELEVRLDEWAEQVRDRVIAATGDGVPAREAVGLRAVALLATGRSAIEIRNLGVVLSASAGESSADDSWQTVDDQARRVLASPTAGALIGDYFAVRQGETGRPQLVDTLELQGEIDRCLADPRGALVRFASSSEARTQYDAKTLLESAQSAVEAQHVKFVHSRDRVVGLLGGASPSEVGDFALEVGRAARESGFFRPADRWQEFQRASDYLSDRRDTDVGPEIGNDFNEVLSNQWRIRAIRILASNLDIVHRAMSSTRVECESSSADVGSASNLRKRVESQVSEIDRLVAQLAGGTR